MLTPGLIKGDNVLTVKAINEDTGPAGFIAKLKIQRGDKKSEIVSDATWEFSPSGAGDWKPAIVVGKAGDDPWAGSIEVDTLDLTENKAPETTPVARIKVKEGFKVERLYSVPLKTQGSWVAL